MSKQELEYLTSGFHIWIKRILAYSLRVYSIVFVFSCFDGNKIGYTFLCPRLERKKIMYFIFPFA